MLRSTSDFVLYVLLFVGVFLIMRDALTPFVNVGGDIGEILLLLTLLSYFALLFNGVRTLFATGMATTIFACIVLALEINF